MRRSAANLRAVNPVAWPDGADGGAVVGSGGGLESSSRMLWGNEGFVFDVL